MTSEILILCGLPGSGKSTYAAEWIAEDPETRVRINYDSIREELYGPRWKFNHPEEKAMKAHALARANGVLMEGKSLVIDNTNLTEKARKPWMDLATTYGIVPQITEMDTDLWDCVYRDSGRPNTGEVNGSRLGRAVIERMALFTGWIDWDDTEYRGMSFVIVDVDGTLADCSHRKHFIEEKPKRYDAFFKACHEDTLIEPVANLVEMLADRYHVIIVSGRPTDFCGIPTEDWLDRHGIRYEHLFMRQGGDYRPDYVIKQEILDLLPKERIAYVLDDRDQVVDMWRRNGLTTLQVNKGDF